ncbi:MAG: 50S ribosomal protein L6 [Gammaproteobacteria bacterium]|nr:50S ribosomal protein L6 [Gammaproteobacteria bacterium]
MSRVAKSPVEIPGGVDFNINSGLVTVKGPKGQLEHQLHELVEISQDDNVLTFAAKDNSQQARALSGTTRAVVSNMVTGVSQGFEKKMTIIGVGYRAAVQGSALNLTLGFSHPVAYPIPEGITIECPSQTEIVVKGANKQQVGQVAAEIRAYRPPEPYKGKGVRYTDEHVIRKEAKKK